MNVFSHFHQLWEKETQRMLTWLPSCSSGTQATFYKPVIIKDAVRHKLFKTGVGRLRESVDKHTATLGVSMKPCPCEGNKGVPRFDQSLFLYFYIYYIVLFTVCFALYLKLLKKPCTPSKF